MFVMTIAARLFSRIFIQCRVVNVVGVLVRENYRREVSESIRFDHAFHEGELSMVEQDFVAIVFD